MNFNKYMKYHLSNGTSVFVVSLQTKKLHAILTFCPIFVLMSHCVLWSYKGKSQRSQDRASSYQDRAGLLSTFFKTDISSSVKELRMETILMMKTGKGAPALFQQELTPSKDYKVQDMTVNTKSHKRLTCSVCCLLAATESESITVNFSIYLKS